MKIPWIWVVEIFFMDTNRWEPTVGAALNRTDARRELAKWRKNNVSDRFRLTRYRRL